jgi:hypothetical protein
MTEAEWILYCDRPGFEAMLEHLEARGADERLRLVGCALCRAVRDLLEDERSRAALDVAERYAEGRAKGDERARARKAAWWAWQRVTLNHGLVPGRPVWAVGTDSPEAQAAGAAERLLDPDPFSTRELSVTAEMLREAVGAELDFDLEDWDRRPSEHWDRACRLVREVYGNPFRPVALDPAWLRWNDGTVRRVAQSLHERRAFGELPVLADALEEAGCTDAVMLGHCRSGGPHVCGCWALDLLRGRVWQRRRAGSR